MGKSYSVAKRLDGSDDWMTLEMAMAWFKKETRRAHDLVSSNSLSFEPEIQGVFVKDKNGQPCKMSLHEAFQNHRQDKVLPWVIWRI